MVYMFIFQYLIPIISSSYALPPLLYLISLFLGLFLAMDYFWSALLCFTFDVSAMRNARTSTASLEIRCISFSFYFFDSFTFGYDYFQSF
jgi:hypothetical protein